MKPELLIWPALAVASALALTSCSSTPGGETSTMTATKAGVPGGVFVETHEGTATVKAIDTVKRKITLVSAAGKEATFKAGPDVVNFDQIKVGDQLWVKAAEELVVAMANDVAPQGEGAASAVALAPQGAKPGALMAETVQVKAKVTAIDLKHHKSTLQFPDGSTKTIPVRKDVDLTQRKVGEEVVIRYTEALAIMVAKP